MEKIIILMFTLSCFQVHAKSQNVLKCETKSCPDCLILVDVSKEIAEYNDNESSYFLKQLTKTQNNRVFEIQSNSSVGSPGYSLILERKKRTATLSQLNLDQSKKVLYKNVDCSFTNSQIDSISDSK